jgi:hypothetical protein
MGTTYNTANPAYIVDSTLTDGEAWVACATHVETGTGTTDITLSSTTGCNNWSQYQDLVILASVRSEYATTNNLPRIYYNGDTTDAHYRRQMLRDDGSATMAFLQENPYIMFATGASSLANTFGTNFIRIHGVNAGYCKTTAVQNAACDNNVTTGCYMGTSIYGNSSNADVYYGIGDIQKAITSITFNTFTGWKAGSRFDIFGVLPKLVIG